METRPIRISLLGRLELSIDGRSIRGLDGQKAQELLCYLLLHRGRPHHRDRLAGLLWPDQPTAQAKKYLRQALWQVQTSLDEAAGRLLVTDQDWIDLDASIPLRVDVDEIDHCFALLRGVSVASISVELASSLATAVRLYVGELLEGWYHDWCVLERDRIQHRYLTLVDRLISYHLAHREVDRGLELGARALRSDPAREHVHRTMMELHALVGDRTSAVRQYQRCVGSLREDVGVEPSSETQQLYQRICVGSLVDTVPPSMPEQDAAFLASDDGTALVRRLLAEVMQARSALQRLERLLPTAEGQ